MDNTQNKLNEFLSVEIVQSGDVLKVSLSPTNLKKSFNVIYVSLLKELKLKQKDTYLSNDSGKMVGEIDLKLSLGDIIKIFGKKLKLYYEKII